MEEIQERFLHRTLSKVPSNHRASRLRTDLRPSHGLVRQAQKLLEEPQRGPPHPSGSTRCQRPIRTAFWPTVLSCVRLTRQEHRRLNRKRRPGMPSAAVAAGLESSRVCAVITGSGNSLAGRR